MMAPIETVKEKERKARAALSPATIPSKTINCFYICRKQLFEFPCIHPAPCH